jgi:8-oxo-dGTP pyrophosphatase MutT (NUDIX family)
MFKYQCGHFDVFGCYMGNKKGFTSAFNPSCFITFKYGTEDIGWLQPGFAKQLRRWPAYFHEQQQCVTLSDALSDAQTRTAALAQCTRQLAQEKFINGWRGETYAVFSKHSGAPPLFHIERAAMRRFGLTARGASLNAYVGSGASLRMWLARRSPTKPIDPGLLDNLVGGGVASGYAPWETLLKESYEEANLPVDVAANARFTGTVSSLREVCEGVHSEIIYVYDLALPTRFIPTNRDGEVSELRLATVPELLAMLEQREFSVEAGLIVIDFLLRHALISSSFREFETLLRGAQHL